MTFARVRPFFHVMGDPRLTFNPYSRLLELLEELAALRKMNIHDPSLRRVWAAEPSKDRVHEVTRCLTRFRRLSALFDKRRAGCAEYWKVHLADGQFPCRVVVRSVLGLSRPPIPFDQWTIWTLRPPTKRR